MDSQNTPKAETQGVVVVDSIPILDAIPITPQGLQMIYEGVVTRHNILTTEIKQLLRRAIDANQGGGLKTLIAGEPPLLELLMLFEAEAGNSSTKSTPKVSSTRKRLSLTTPPSAKKEASAMKKKKEVINNEDPNPIENSAERPIYLD